MKINGVEIDRKKIKQLRFENSHRKISNRSEWMPNTDIPLFFGAQFGFTTLKLYVAVYGEGKEDVIKNRSFLLSKFKKVTEIQLDNYEHKFQCVLHGVTVKESIKRKCHEVMLELIGYEFGNEITESMGQITSKKISVSGNDNTPCIVEITPTFDISSITLTGIARNPITKAGEKVIIKNLKNGQKITIDGEAGTVTQGGQNKFADTEMWEFPSLAPGSNTITCSSSQCNITIKYKPRFI